MNLPKQRHFFLSVQTVFIYMLAFTQTPDLPVSKYGMPVIRDYDIYVRTIKTDSNKQMVELKSLIPNIVYDLRYSSNKNFMRRNMYPLKTRTTYLRLPAAKALALVQHELNEKGMGLKIFDAYRPYSVTEKFWELVMDEKYVADPKKGSGHNRGLAVDLTIVYSATGKELQMPTYFDNFSDTAHQNFMNLPFEALQNRKLLRDTMEKYGFKMFDTEWWHFSWPDDRKYEVMDIPFSDFKDADRESKK
jgi:zinc D-Ala-D-Ala dipeptidase